jgi:hypothetical protein
MMTYLEAYNDFDLTIRPLIDIDDEVMLDEEWSNYTNMLCENGDINALQYHYCPSLEDDIPSRDVEYLLECLNVDSVLTDNQLNDLIELI